MLTDGDRIRNLLAEYCVLVDAGALDGVGRRMADVVAPDGEGSWKFVRRAFGPGLNGDLSHHMEITL